MNGHVANATFFFFLNALLLLIFAESCDTELYSIIMCWLKKYLTFFAFNPVACSCAMWKTPVNNCSPVIYLNYSLYLSLDLDHLLASAFPHFHQGVWAYLVFPHMEAVPCLWSYMLVFSGSTSWGTNIRLNKRTSSTRVFSSLPQQVNNVKSQQTANRFHLGSNRALMGFHFLPSTCWTKWTLFLVCG